MRITQNSPLSFHMMEQFSPSLQYLNLLNSLYHTNAHLWRVEVWIGVSSSMMNHRGNSAGLRSNTLGKHSFEYFRELSLINVNKPIAINLYHVLMFLWEIVNMFCWHEMFSISEISCSFAQRSFNTALNDFLDSSCIWVPE